MGQPRVLLEDVAEIGAAARLDPDGRATDRDVTAVRDDDGAGVEASATEPLAGEVLVGAGDFGNAVVADEAVGVHGPHPDPAIVPATYDLERGDGRAVRGPPHHRAAEAVGIETGRRSGRSGCGCGVRRCGTRRRSPVGCSTPVPPQAGHGSGIAAYNPDWQ